jgi:hypothetical protein
MVALERRRGHRGAVLPYEGKSTGGAQLRFMDAGLTEGVWPQRRCGCGDSPHCGHVVLHDHGRHAL